MQSGALLARFLGVHDPFRAPGIHWLRRHHRSCFQGSLPSLSRPDAATSITCRRLVRSATRVRQPLPPLQSTSSFLLGCAWTRRQFSGCPTRGGPTSESTISGTGKKRPTRWCYYYAISRTSPTGQTAVISMLVFPTLNLHVSEHDGFPEPLAHSKLSGILEFLCPSSPAVWWRDWGGGACRKAVNVRDSGFGGRRGPLVT